MKLLAVQRFLLRFMAYASFALVLFGLKLLVISHFGNRTPNWDQWDDEGLLFQRWRSHQFAWPQLFLPHNEHRIVFTRLLVLGLLKINGLWDPFLEMIVNAGVHIVGICMLLYFLDKVSGRMFTGVFLFFSALLFGFPFAWENTLWGFQSQFYFMWGFSALSIWLFSKAAPFDWRWLGGLACAAAAFLSMASGLITLAAMACVLVCQFATGAGRTKLRCLSFLVIGAGFLAMVKLTPVMSDNELRATRFSEFYDAALSVSSWSEHGSLVMALLVNLPVLILIGRVLIRRSRPDDPHWFLAALGIWSFGQFAAIAYGRSVICRADRYFDLFSVSIMVNLACALIIMRMLSEVGGRAKRAGGWAFCAGWMAMISVGLMDTGTAETLRELRENKARNLAGEKNVRQFVFTNDPRFILGKGGDEIPYPSPEALINFLDTPEIRSILPSNIRKPLALSLVSSTPDGAFIQNGVYGSVPLRQDVFGSYSKSGDNAVGEAIVKVERMEEAHWIELPFAGYPAKMGMAIGVLEKQKETPVRISTNPRESWDTVRFRVGRGSSRLRLIDGNHTSWFAIAAPVVLGNLEPMVDLLLASAPFVVASGILLGLLTFFIRLSDQKNPVA